MIRRFQPKDKANCRQICVDTTLMKKTARSIQWLPILFNDYYTEQQSDFVFVATDDEDNAVGYVLCAPDRRDFVSKMKSIYIPQVKKISPAVALYFGLTFDGAKERKFVKDYPAHLHIDILPSFQRGGLGHKLVDALVAKLKSVGVSGVMLGCSANNPKGLGFYRKYGFTEIERNRNEVFFGLKIDKKD